MREVELPSGAKLRLQIAPFVDGKALYQAFAKEIKGLKMSFDLSSKIDANFAKDVICTALSSPEIDAALTKCMKRSIYNGQKIDENTFEPEEARQDYFEVQFEVAKENLLPFTKSLYAKYAPLLELLKDNSPA